MSATPELAARFRAVRRQLGFDEHFPPDVLSDAEESARSPRLAGHRDLTEVAFVTLDPPTAQDLDQAFHLERRRGGGFRLRYAIADLAAFVRPGGRVDAEAHRRVETAYSPDAKTPLHPPVLSERAASLHPDRARPAAVWTIDVDDDGVLASVEVVRAMVRSRAKLGYPEVQAQLDSGRADPMLSLLPDVGSLLRDAERRRGGTSLNTPTQEVVAAEGAFRLVHRAPMPCEGWNAQLSLLTGRAAARLMLDGGIGILRTMPPADERDVRRLRAVARGLGLRWPHEVTYAELLDGLDARRSPAEAAFLEEAAVLFRGAGYTPFDGTAPALTVHAAIAAPYAHCSAPLRRLVDRYSTEVCLALSAGRPVPAWARDALAVLPDEMAEGRRRTRQLERANLDLVEAAVLAPLVGLETDAVVIDVWKHDRGEIVLAEPAVIAPCDGPLELGELVRVRLVEVEVGTGTVRFERTGP